MSMILWTFLCLGTVQYASSSLAVWEFGTNDDNSIVTSQDRGKIGMFEKTTVVPFYVPPCYRPVYVRVEIDNVLSNPSVTYAADVHQVTIQYTWLQNALSYYNVVVKSLNDSVYIKEDLKMHPTRQFACDALLENPALTTPPPEPERPRPPRVRRPRVFKLPPRFPLLSKDFYSCWCNHRKELQMTRHKVDDSPPELFPELYLKPRRLDYYARQLEENMHVNKELLKRINMIQRTGGYVDCWNVEPNSKYNKLLCRQRQRDLNHIRKQNLYIYSRLLIARSEQPLTKELDESWKDTKHKLILGASLPFILFTTEKIDRDIRDPAFDKPPHIQRTKVSMEIWVRSGAKIGKVVVELFTDLVPKTCQMFLNLVRGDPNGHAYCGTRFFRIVPGLYCCGGDVTKDNGFGCYQPNEDEPMGAESYKLKHTVPGVLSMVVTPDNELCGHFNIIFKPLPQFDGKHVVFGRIIAGPSLALERISALGLPLGTPTSDCMIRYCGWFTRAGLYREGAQNTTKFPPRKH